MEETGPEDVLVERRTGIRGVLEEAIIQRGVGVVEVGRLGVIF